MATVIRKKNLGNITSTKEVQDFLKNHGIAYDHWEVPESANSLIQKDTLNDSEKEDLLMHVNNRFEHLQKTEGYKTRDLIVLHPGVEGLDGMLSKFDRVHYHTDDEVRYILDGSGYFGFVTTSEKFLVHVGMSDFISVPKNTNHWFYLDDKKRIKAVRYFTDMSGWVPNYVEVSNSIED